MPRKAINFQNTIIYKIVCKDLLVTEKYIGHTTDFTKRKNSHKTRCNNPNDKMYNCYVYIFIRENGGWDNWTMIEIEKYPCLDVNEARKQERYFIELLIAELNQQIPSKTKQEWNEQHIEQTKEYMKEYGKEYRELNRDKISKNKREYDKQNRDKLTIKQREYRALKKLQSSKEDA